MEDRKIRWISRQNDIRIVSFIDEYSLAFFFFFVSHTRAFGSIRQYDNIINNVISSLINKHIGTLIMIVIMIIILDVKSHQRRCSCVFHVWESYYYYYLCFCCFYYFHNNNMKINFGVSISNRHRNSKHQIIHTVCINSKWNLLIFFYYNMYDVDRDESSTVSVYKIFIYMRINIYM